MTPQDIAQVISSVGFPIVAAAALFWYMYKQQVNHKEEMEGLKDALNKNTTVLSELKEVINFLIKGQK